MIIVSIEKICLSCCSIMNTFGHFFAEKVKKLLSVSISQISYSNSVHAIYCRIFVTFLYYVNICIILRFPFETVQFLAVSYIRVCVRYVPRIFRNLRRKGNTVCPRQRNGPREPVQGRYGRCPMERDKQSFNVIFIVLVTFQDGDICISFNEVGLPFIQYWLSVVFRSLEEANDVELNPGPRSPSKSPKKDLLTQVGCRYKAQVW